MEGGFRYFGNKKYNNSLLGRGGFRYITDYNSMLGSGRRCEFCMRGYGVMPIRNPYNYFDKGIGGYFGNPNLGGI